MFRWPYRFQTTLRRCASAGGALEKGLNTIASRDSAIAVLNPLEWLVLAENILTAVWEHPSDRMAKLIVAEEPVSAVTLTPTVTSQRVTPFPGVPTSSVARTLATASAAVQYTRPPHAPGWGANPFQPALPPKTSSAPQVTRPSVTSAQLQALIEQDAFFLFYSRPDTDNRSEGIGYYDDTGKRQVIGFHLSNDLHRFNVMVSAPTNRAPLASRDKLGEIVGTSTWRWMFKPVGFAGNQHVEPPPTEMDSDADQEFVMLDGLFRLGDGENGFHAMGAGRTHPVMIRGRKELNVTAIGVLTEGFGKFAGRDHGIFVQSGTITAAGFRGSLILRVPDLPGTLQTPEPIPELQRIKTFEYGVTWLTLRATAIPSTSAVPLPPDSPQPGVVCTQDLRLIDMDVSTNAADVLRCTTAIRQIVGSVTSYITFDRAVGQGGVADPMPFAVRSEFSFVDFLGKPVGGFTTESADGRALFTDLAGVVGIRFASTGKVIGGTGRFVGMRALVSANMLATLEPWAASSVYTLRVEDPEGRFFAHAGVWRDIPVSEIGTLGVFATGVGKKQ
jgi:hypothetical protein